MLKWFSKVTLIFIYILLKIHYKISIQNSKNIATQKEKEKKVAISGYII